MNLNHMLPTFYERILRVYLGTFKFNVNSFNIPLFEFVVSTRVYYKIQIGQEDI